MKLKLKPQLLCWFLGLCLALALACAADEQTFKANDPGRSSGVNHPKQQNIRAADDRSAETDIWNGLVNGLRIRWTTRDVYAEKSNGVEKIFSPLVKFQVDRLSADWRESGSSEQSDCEYSRHFKLLSVVGSLLSFEDESTIACGRARPSSNLRFTTVDLIKAGEITDASDKKLPLDQFNVTKASRVMRLTDYFTEDEIFQAMITNPLISDAIHNLNAPSPRTFSDLRSLFIKNPGAINVEGESFTLDQDFVTRFTFYAIENDNILVQISLSPSAAAAQALRGSLNLALSIPKGLRQDLRSAQNRTKGFLAKDADEISHGKTSDFFLKF